jgi:hypothetical protein
MKEKNTHLDVRSAGSVLIGEAYAQNVRFPPKPDIGVVSAFDPKQTLEDIRHWGFLRAKALSSYGHA